MRFSAQKGVSSQRRNAISDQMQERLQYTLALLLLVLAGSLEGRSFRDDAQNVQPVLTESTVADSSAAVRNYLSAAIHSCDLTAETPVISFDHKAILRHRTAVRAAADAAFGVRAAMCTYSPVLHSDAVDYYVFSLGRIRI